MVELYWEFICGEFGVNFSYIKDVMRFFEEIGEFEIKCFVDGKRLWVMILRDIKRNLVKFD